MAPNYGMIWHPVRHANTGIHVILLTYCVFYLILFGLNDVSGLTKILCLLGIALRMVVQAFKRDEEMNGNLSLRSAKRRRDTVQVFECSHFPLEHHSLVLSF